MRDDEIDDGKEDKKQHKKVKRRLGRVLKWDRMAGWRDRNRRSIKE